MFDAVNAPLLDDVMTRGKTIVFSHDPFQARPGAFLEMEREYILNGPFAGAYSWDPRIGPAGAAVPAR